MKQIYFLFVVLLVVMTACGGKKEASVDAEQLMFQIDSVDHVTGLQRMQVSRIDQHIVSGGKKYNLFIERAPSDSPCLQSKVTWGFLPTIVSSLEFPVKMGAGSLPKLLPSKVSLDS
jgi:hypothetical protein